MSAIRKSARGEQCQIRIPGVCNGNPETVVLCHANGSAAGKGIGQKSHDLISAYGCSACHDVYDRREKQWRDRFEVELAFWHGHARTLCILIEKGLVKV